MKVDRKKLETDIEYAISQGAWLGEEVDVTTKNVLAIIEPLIKAVEHEEG